MLQYITNTNAPVSIIEQVRKVLDGGCKWIQLRMKDADDEEFKSTAEKLKPLCQEHDAFLVLNDRVAIAKELEVSGVHLGKNDMLPSKARIELGGGPVIGVTANTFEDVEAVRYFDIDYIGLGPYGYTDTKKNLAPVLGIEGIRKITSAMREAEITIPTVAVGGIRLEDVVPLMEAGVNGVAVSGAIAFADDITATTKSFVLALDAFRN